MKIVVSSDGEGMDAPASPVFGRAPYYVFVRTGSMDVDVMENPAVSTASGAGIQAAQLIVDRGVDAVVSGRVGPNAFEVLRSADVPVYVFEGGTVREAIEAYQQGELAPAGTATGPAHVGMGRGRGMGRGAGRARRQPGPTVCPAAPAEPETPERAEAGTTRDQEIAELKELARDLRGQMADAMDRLDQLEEGE